MAYRAVFQPTVLLALALMAVIVMMILPMPAWAGAAMPDAICEYVRQRLGFQLVSGLKRADGTLPLIQLSPKWEDAFLSYQIEGERGALDVALPPDLFSRLTDGVAAKVSEAGDRGVSSAVVTSARRRRFLRTLLCAKGISTPVLSFEEIGVDARPALVGTVAA